MTSDHNMGQQPLQVAPCPDCLVKDLLNARAHGFLHNLAAFWKPEGASGPPVNGPS